MASIQDMVANARKLLGSGQLDRARDVLLDVVRVDPAQGDALLMLGFIEKEAGRPADAERWVRQCVETSPNSAEARVNLGVLVSAQGREAEAEREFRSALRINPSLAMAHYSLAKTLRNLGRLDEALETLRASLRIDPRIAPAHLRLAIGLCEQGRVLEAIESLNTAISLGTANDVALPNRLMAFNCVMSDPAMVFAEHKRFGDALVAQAGPPRAHKNVRNPERVIRLGLVSADLRLHSCAYFLEPILSRLDPARFELACYSNSTLEDAVTARFKGYAWRWRSVAGVTVAEADAMIRADKVDVLIECSGHTDSSRLDILAAKPAPVQGTFLGYPNTTGLSTIDFRIVDSISDPPAPRSDSDSRCVERLVRLDPCAWCYRPSEEAPEVAPPPFRSAGHITFGSFNNLTKLSRAAVELWSRVLDRVPGSKLVIKNRWMSDPPTAERVRERFATCGIDRARIITTPFAKGVREHLAIYGQVDLQLDTFPYHGTTTTCESFWQGVPVVTLTGNVHASRVSTSLLHAVGLGDLAAETPKGFVDTAVALAQDTERLARIRAGLRGMMERSPLRDEAGYAAKFSEVIRAEFARWCAGRK